ncbi:MAG: hypothetical protein PHO02_07365 [Candidatus Nanoarchaeia archaeon]|nr:hypothetical protein [Candidatus Nanoarchaeia archaeon]
MRYTLLILLLALLLVAGCAKQGIEIVAPGDMPAEEASAEPTELAGDMAALEEESPLEMDIDTAELETLDM